MIKSFVLLTCILSCFGINAQKSSIEVIRQYNSNKIVEIDNHELTKSSFFSSYKKSLGLSDDDHFVMVKEIRTPDGFTRAKYKQYYKKLPVVGSMFTLHESEQVIRKATGNILPFINVNTRPEIEFDHFKDDIKNQLMESMDNLGYTFKINQEKIHYHNEGLKIMDKGYPKFTGNYVLVYHIVAEPDDHDFPFKEDIYIDANTGNLVNHFSVVHTHNVPGVVKTKYYGQQNVIIDSIASDHYLLQDLTRGNGVFTMNNDLEVYSHDSKFWDLENENQDEIAGDLHYCSTSFFDMMLEKFGWEGIDGEGGELIGATHAGGKYLVNAFWNGTRARFGNGDCDRYTPLTTLGIVGHEFAHGITDYTSDLIYRAESGALNESMSDIFGKALEYYFDNENFNWKIGDRIRRNEDVNVIRSMEDPGVRNDPKFYKGENWWTSSGDNYGVHTNSGVLNFWFYLLVNGEIGVNENNENYAVQSIGMDDAMQIVFTMQSAYLTENSTYFDAVNASVEAVKDHFGESTLQMSMVLEAWKAVGLSFNDSRISVLLQTESDVISACPGDVVYPQVKFFNIGDAPIQAGQTLILKFESNDRIDLIEESLTLDESFEVGDSIEYVFKTPITNSLDNIGTYTFSIASQDQSDFVLDDISGTFSTSEINATEVSLLDARIFKSDVCDAESSELFRYRIRNDGCTILERNDSLYFDVVTNVGDFQVGARIFSDLRSGIISSSTRTLSFATSDPVPENIEDFSVTLRYVGDTDASNNVVNNEVPKQVFISDGYSESFEEEKLFSEYLIFGNDFYTHDSIISHRNNKMLAVYGLRDHEFFRNCELDEDFFNEYFFKSSMRYCVDGSQMANPVFEFDVMQFANENGIAELTNSEYSTMVQVEYEDGTFDVIYGQPEGSLLNHKFDLPPYYSGELQINILALSQIEHIISHNFVEDKDIVLLDDIRLYERGTYNPVRLEGGYVVFPNPTTNIIKVEHSNSNKIFAVEVYNAIGQRVYNKESIVNQDWVDLTDWESGVYMINIFEEGDRSTSTKIIKVD